MNVSANSTRSIPSRGFWGIIVGGMITGMGNGSVFGACVMCAMGRGNFDNWGGIGTPSYNPTTFSGFVNWSMITFGIAFVVILAIALTRHDRLERAAR